MNPIPTTSKPKQIDIFHPLHKSSTNLRKYKDQLKILKTASEGLKSEPLLPHIEDFLSKIDTYLENSLTSLEILLPNIKALMKNKNEILKSAEEIKSEILISIDEILDNFINLKRYKELSRKLIKKNKKNLKGKNLKPLKNFLKQLEKLCNGISNKDFILLKRSAISKNNLKKSYSKRRKENPLKNPNIDMDDMFDRSEDEIKPTHDNDPFEMKKKFEKNSARRELKEKKEELLPKDENGKIKIKRKRLVFLKDLVDINLLKKKVKFRRKDSERRVKVIKLKKDVFRSMGKSGLMARKQRRQIALRTRKKTTQSAVKVFNGKIQFQGLDLLKTPLSSRIKRKDDEKSKVKSGEQKKNIVHELIQSMTDRKKSTQRDIDKHRKVIKTFVNRNA